MNEPANFSNTPPQPLQPEIKETLVTPIATYTLVIITVIIYLLQTVTNALLGVDLPAAYGMKINDFILTGDLWRLITPMFLHGSLLHIGFNMYALVVIGSGLERRFGHWRFVTLYFMGSIAGNVFSFILSPNPSLGASTSIFGLLGAEMVFFYQNKELFGSGAKKALQNVITVAAINLLIGLSPGIDNWGHLGGLIGGLIFTWFAGPKLHFEGFSQYIEVVDERTTNDIVLGAGLVLLLFGTLTYLKMIGIFPN